LNITMPTTLANDTCDGKQQEINSDVSVGNVQVELLGSKRADNNRAGATCCWMSMSSQRQVASFISAYSNL
jgi:hypothetical protein